MDSLISQNSDVDLFLIPITYIDKVCYIPVANLSKLKKEESLNKFVNEVVNMEYLINNLKNNPKFKLTPYEVQAIIKPYYKEKYKNANNDNLRECAYRITSVLKRKIKLMMVDLFNIDITAKMEICPPFLFDHGLKNSHYERHNDKWVLVNSRSNVKKIVNIFIKQLKNDYNELLEIDENKITTFYNITFHMLHYDIILKDKLYKFLMEELKRENLMDNIIDIYSDLVLSDTDFDEDTDEDEEDLKSKEEEEKKLPKEKVKVLKKVIKPKEEEEEEEEKSPKEKVKPKRVRKLKEEEVKPNEEEAKPKEEEVKPNEEEAKPKRGRKPKKDVSNDDKQSLVETPIEAPIEAPKKRGRPKKTL